MVPAKLKWSALVVAGVLLMSAAHAGGAFHLGFHSGFHTGFHTGFHSGFHTGFRGVGGFHPGFRAAGMPDIFFGVRGFHPVAPLVHPGRRYPYYWYGPLHGWYGRADAPSRYGWQKWYRYSDFSRINYPGVDAPAPAGRRDEDYR